MVDSSLVRPTGLNRWVTCSLLSPDVEPSPAVSPSPSQGSACSRLVQKEHGQVQKQGRNVRGGVCPPGPLGGSVGGTSIQTGASDDCQCITNQDKAKFSMTFLCCSSGLSFLSGPGYCLHSSGKMAVKSGFKLNLTRVAISTVVTLNDCVISLRALSWAALQIQKIDSSVMSCHINITIIVKSDKGVAQSAFEHKGDDFITVLCIWFPVLFIS